MYSESIRKNNVKVNITAGILAAVGMNLVNPYFSKFALRLGANDFHIAMISSLPAFLALLAMIPGALFIDRLKSKIHPIAYMLLAQKVMYLLIALIPFLPLPMQPLTFVIAIGIMNIPGSISQMGYQSAIGDIFLPEYRATAMSLRNRYADVFRMITTFAAGQALNLIPSTPSEIIMLYQIFFIIAFIIGVLEMRQIWKFEVQHEVKNTKLNLKEAITSIRGNKKFMIFVLCSLSFHFGWQMGWPIFSIYTLKVLNANEGWLSAISIASGLSAILTTTLWAKACDKYGNSTMLFVATTGMAITPFFYIIINSLWQLTLFNIIIGISVAGTILILFNLLLEVTPKENRTLYIAVYNTIINASATISPIIGVTIMTQTNVYISLAIVGALRFIGAFTFYLRQRLQA